MRIIIYVEDNGFTAEMPGLSGCFVHGETIYEAVDKIVELSNEIVVKINSGEDEHYIDTEEDFHELGKDEVEGEDEEE